MGCLVTEVHNTEVDGVQFFGSYNGWWLSFVVTERLDRSSSTPPPALLRPTGHNSILDSIPTSPRLSLDEKFLYNYTDINLLPELKRIEGVGFADIMGSREYSMRIWMNPDKMTNDRV